MTSELMNRRLGVVAVWLLLGVVSLYVYFFEPGRTGLFPGCPFRMLTGYQCPGCGSTRALHQLVHGHFGAAFTFNPLFTIAAPILLFLFVRHSFFIMRGHQPRKYLLPAPVIYGLFFVILSFWILRNTSIYPFVS